jgi:hypothetical protein
MHFCTERAEDRTHTRLAREHLSFHAAALVSKQEKRGKFRLQKQTNKYPINIRSREKGGWRKRRSKRRVPKSPTPRRRIRRRRLNPIDRASQPAEDPEMVSAFFLFCGCTL